MLGVGSGSSKSGKIKRIVKNGLQAWYKADKTQGPSGSIVNSIEDNSSNDNHGVLYSGKALSFDGNDQKVDFGNPGYSMKTLAFWINLDSTTEKILQLTSSQSVEVSSGTITLNGTWTGSVIYVDTTATSTIAASSWKRVVITITSAITVDGLELGNISTNFGDFDMADLQIYDSTWSASDVAYDYSNPDKDVFNNGNSSILNTNCLALYRLNEGAGDRVYNAAPFLGANLIGNSDFSSGISGWVAGASGTIEHVTSFGGRSNVAKITTPTAYHNDNKAYHTFTATPNAIYEVKLDVYVVSGQFRVDGDNNDLTGGAGLEDIIHQGVTSGWVTVSGIAIGESSADASTQLWIRAQSTTSDLECYVDNVSVKEITLSNSYAQANFDNGWVTAQQHIPQYTMSSYSKKMIFDGSNDVVDCSSGSSIDDIFNGGGSWSAWFSVETDGEGSAGTMLCKGTSFLRTLNDAGGDVTMQFLYTFSGDNGGWTAPTDAVLLNKINHIVVTYDSSSPSNNPTIYINGVSVLATEAATGPSGSASSDASQDFIIGAQNSSGDQAYDGFIDEVSVWDKELSATEVSEIFNSGIALDCRDHSAASDLQAYWRNNGTDQWDDLSDNSNHGTVGGSPTTIQLQEVPFFNKDTFGLPMNKVRQKGLNFDEDSYVQVTDDSSLGDMDNGFTCSFWYRHAEDVGAGNYFWLVTKGTGHNAGVNNGLAISSYDNKIFAHLNTADGQFQSDYSISAASPSAPVWHYVTVTYNGSAAASSNLILYTDETSRESTAVTGDASDTAEAYPLMIGTNHDNSGNKRARGVIDEVKWYNRALSLGEIKKNYKATKSRHSSTSSWSDDFSSDFI